jgi:transcription antitermination factor NusG
MSNTEQKRKPAMGLEQKKRVANALREALTWRERLNLARITDAPDAKLDELRAELERAEATFEGMLRTRGLKRGDVVRIIVAGPFLDAQARIEEIERGSDRLRMVVDGTSVLPLAHEVKLIKPCRE